MNDLTIHEGLTDASTRDAICDGLLATYFTDEKVKPTMLYPHNSSTTDKIVWSICDRQDKIKAIEKDIERDKTRLALITLMELKGWAEHDISDEISKGGEYNRTFIGTEEEYNNLIKNL